MARFVLDFYCMLFFYRRQIIRLYDMPHVEYFFAFAFAMVNVRLHASVMEK